LYWRFVKLDCFDTNWQHKRPLLVKIVHAGPKSPETFWQT